MQKPERENEGGNQSYISPARNFFKNKPAAFLFLFLSLFLFIGFCCFALAVSVIAYQEIEARTTPQGLYNKGLRYASPLGHGKRHLANFPEAIKWINKSRDAGYIPAFATLCNLHQGNKTTGIKDYTTAFKHCRYAADYNQPIAQADLGLLYLDGLGVDKNVEEAYFWLKLSQRWGPVRSNRPDPKLDLAQKLLSPSKLDEINKRVIKWLPKDDALQISENEDRCNEELDKKMDARATADDRKSCMFKCVRNMRPPDPRKVPTPFCPY